MIWEFAGLLGRRLLAWAVASVLLGVALVIAGDEWWQGFGVQAVAWGAIDGFIGAAGIRGARVGRARSAGDGGAQRREARRLRRLLLLNAGLDVLYVVGGLALAGPVASGDQFLAGMGWGVVVQGLFLLVFDLLHARWVPDGSPLIPDGLELFSGPEHRAVLLRPSGAAHAGPAAVLVHGFGGTPAELRLLADRLVRVGWTVDVPLLLGFGEAIRELPDRRATDWLGAVAEAGERLRADGHGPIMLVGFSLGAALVLAASPRVRPDGIVLIAPFWWPERRLLRLVGPLVRPFLPTGLRPFRRLDLAQPDVRAGVAAFMPGLDLDDPAVAVTLRDLRVPVSLLEQLVVTSRWAADAAPRVRAPVLGVVGTEDTVAAPDRARRLLAMLPTPARILEVDAGHEMLNAVSPVRERIESAVVTFAGDLPARLLGQSSPVVAVAEAHR